MKHYPKYKDSGVEWIGEVPEGWELKKLKYASCINPTKEATLDKNSDELVTFLPMENVSESGQVCCDNKKSISSLSTGFTYFKKHDVIIAKITPCFENGKGALLNKLDTEIGFGSTEFHVLRAVESSSPAFLFYITRTYQFRTLGEAFMSGAAGQKRVPTDFIEEFLVALPPVSEQTTIATFLDRKTAEIDSIISKKERMIELYEEEKASVINHAVTKGLDPAAKMKDSGIEWLGEIPAHWEVKKLKHLVCKIGSGVTPKGGASVYQQSGVPLLRSQNIHFDGLRLDDVAYISDEIHNNMSGSKIVSGDVLLNITGASIGRCYFVDYQLGEANVNQHVCIIRPSEGFITKFIYFLLCSNVGQIQIDLEQTGGGREGLNFEALGSFTIPVGEKNEQTAIVQHIETKCSKIDALISKFKRQIELLKEYRTALISEAVTGKIDVRENMPR
jgi:type I restriction enzyme, S subunit